MTGQQRDLILYRMHRACESLDEAKVLFEAAHLNAYVNRLYYACFYAACALLQTKGLSTGKHSYLRSMLHKEFVKTHLIPEHLGRFYDLLFDNRQRGDYSDFVSFDVEQVKPWLQQSQEFVDHIDRLIQTTK
jgi:uncharacterized protein (UPF0332 family)